MQHQDALASFENYLSQQSPEPLDLQLLTPARGIALALAFYHDERVEGCALEDDGDMLLFQWGIHDTMNIGAAFFVDITRQLIHGPDAEDEDIWQLSLVFEFDAAVAPPDMGAGNRWCSNLPELPEFQAFARQSPAFQATQGHTPRAVKLSYLHVG